MSSASTRVGRILLLPVHEGQKPRPLQLCPTAMLLEHFSQRILTNPWASTPQVRYSLSSLTTCFVVYVA